MIYVKKRHIIKNFKISPDLEIISFSLKISSFEKHFICAYKPRDKRNDLYINYLESIVYYLNLKNHIFIVGDLNMNWLDNKVEPLKAFCSLNNLYNQIRSPTRNV